MLHAVAGPGYRTAAMPLPGAKKTFAGDTALEGLPVGFIRAATGGYGDDLRPLGAATACDVRTGARV